MPNTDYPSLGEINAIQTAFEGAGYICTTRIATVVKLAAALEKPVLIEGPPGVGKTELAKTCAKVVNRPLVRLCLLYTSPSPRDVEESRMPSSA